MKRLAFAATLAAMLVACSAPPPPPPTATPDLTATAAPVATASAQALAETRAAQTTATAIADATATAVAQTTATALAQITATAEIAALREVAEPAFVEEFADNENFWFTGTFNEVEQNAISDGTFQVRWLAAGNSFEVYELRDFRNFLAELDCALIAGDSDASCGIVFAQQNDVGLYKFELFRDYYRLLLVDGGESQLLAEGAPPTQLELAVSHRLRVIREGTQIRVAVDEQPLFTIDDATFVSGRVGMATGSYNAEGGVEVHLDNFTIYALP